MHLVQLFDHLILTQLKERPSDLSSKGHGIQVFGMGSSQKLHALILISDALHPNCSLQPPHTNRHLFPTLPRVAFVVRSAFWHTTVPL